MRFQIKIQIGFDGEEINACCNFPNLFLEALIKILHIVAIQYVIEITILPDNEF